MTRDARQHGRDGRKRGFTLMELLVVMAIVAIVAGVTVTAAGAIARDARLAVGRNTVAAALQTARALAIQGNTHVAVVFRARPDGPSGQQVEIVLARWTGETWIDGVAGRMTVDRFEPQPDARTWRLPAGIKLAAPLFAGGRDDRWATSSDLRAVARADEMPGVVPAVLFGPAGGTVSRNTRSDADAIFVDFNRDGLQRQGGVDHDYERGVAGATAAYPDHTSYGDLGPDRSGALMSRYLFQRTADDEPFVLPAPFLAVYDDDEARSIGDPRTWRDGATRVEALSEHISARADRIHFNRHSGVVMR